MSTPDLTLLDGVTWQGHDVPKGRGGDLLAALTLAAPRSVAVSELVREVWADDEPAHPEKALQVLVSRVRSQTSPDVVSRVGTGYRLGLRPDQVDLLRLRRLVDDATAARSAGDLDVARLQAREALASAADHRRRGGSARRGGRRGPRRAGPRAAAAGSGAPRPRRRRRGAAPAGGRAGRAAPGDEGLLADVLRAEAQVRGVPAALARYAAYAEAHPRRPRRLARAGAGAAARRAAGARGAGPPGTEVRRHPAGRPRRRRGPDPRAARELARRLDRRRGRARQDPDGPPGGASGSGSPSSTSSSSPA